MGVCGKGSRRRAQKRKASGHANLVPGSTKPIQNNAEWPTAPAAEEASLPKYFRVSEAIQARAGTGTCLSPLRPHKEKLMPSTCGNRVISIEKMTELINCCMKQHLRDHTAHMKVLKVKDLGLGATITLGCKFCNFRISQKLYEEAIHDGIKGHRPAAPNVQLGAFMYKSPVSIADVRLLFAAIDCHPPSSTTLQKCANKFSKIYENLNKAQMTENCQLIQNCRNGHITALTDTVYNNPPKGRNMYQPATQCHTPMIEAETGLILAQKTHSKLGPAANVEAGKPMDSCEGNAMAENLQAATSAGLSINTVISDGCTKVNASLQQLKICVPERQDCIVHVSRRQRKMLHKCIFSEQLVGKPTDNNYNYVRAYIADRIVSRCSAELAIAKRRFGHSSSKFYKAVEQARENIVACLCGKHDHCKQKSMYCNGKPKAKLSCPILNATHADIEAIQKVVDYKLSPESVQKQRSVMSTNKVEALHLRTLKVIPKSKLCVRNYDAKTQSAMHNHSVGTTRSLVLACEKMGAPIKSYTANHFVQRSQHMELYGRLYRRRLYVIRLRHHRHSKFIKLKLFSKLNVETAKLLPNDHHYGTCS